MIAFSQNNHWEYLFRNQSAINKPQQTYTQFIRQTRFISITHIITWLNIYSLSLSAQSKISMRDDNVLIWLLINSIVLKD